MTNELKSYEIHLMKWTDEEYQKALEALDKINPHWSGVYADDR